MTKGKVLITGGAGFIGSHLADKLLEKNYAVRVLDSLSTQVHHPSDNPPDYLDSEVEFLKGDVRNPLDLARALRGVDAVFHFAAAVGVGQSMYEIANYTDINNHGTALLLEELIRRDIKKLIVASSMSIYGEGLYRNSAEKVTVGRRTLQQIQQKKWELYDENFQALKPVPTPESKNPDLTSVYALSKFDQERMCLMVGKTYGISTVALRFFNVYGTRQSLSNPYTGVMAIFASRLLNDNHPLIFEDGLQRRDFIHVKDVTQACLLSLENPQADGRAFNIGSGNNYTVLEIAERMALAMGKEHIRPQVTGKYRMGDIRHCFADMTMAKKILGFEPKISFEEGIAELANWLSGQIAIDRMDEAHQELLARGLAI